MKGILALLLIPVILSPAYPQPDTLWTKIFGTGSPEAGQFVINTSDGGFMILGDTETFGGGGVDAWLIKTDADGNEEWSQTYGGPFEDECYNIYQTSDGGYVFGGRTESYGAGDKDGWLVKVDGNGTEEWSLTYGGPDKDEIFWMSETDDGGYVMVGETEGFGAVGSDIWMVKVDSLGVMEFSQTFDYSEGDNGYHVEQTNDGGYIIGGMAEINPLTMKDAVLIKTDADGNEIWHNHYSEGIAVFSSRVLEASDNGFLIQGYTIDMTQAMDGLLIKTSSDGTFQWSRFIDNGNLEAVYCSIETANGYLSIGFTGGAGGAIDLWIGGIDINGDVLWENSIDVIGNEAGLYITNAAGGGYIATGVTGTISPETEDVLLVRFDEGTFVENPVVDTPKGFALYPPHPNPFNQRVALDFVLPAAAPVKLTIYDIAGREITTLVDEFKNAGNHEIIFDAGDLASGVYLVRLTVDSRRSTVKKMVLMK